MNAPPPDSPRERLDRWLPLSARTAAVVAAVLILATAAFWRRLSEAAVRSAHAATLSQMAEVAVALESYYIDNMQYPAMTLDRSLSVNGDRIPERVALPRGFRLRHTTGLMTLTTPIGYMEGYPVDMFSGTHRTTFAFYRDSSGWIIGSYGPDEDLEQGGQLHWSTPGRFAGFVTAPDRSQVPTETVEGLYSSWVPQPTTTLLTGASTRGAYTYDPTNGVHSSGDIWRLK
ncbi:MAG: hypothetical protein SF028_04875 [Candidatus Sumerlaeia bacterium]|nr:hypothetical protein [Candidatus Sumerlaeia bacterium]